MKAKQSDAVFWRKKSPLCRPFTIFTETNTPPGTYVKLSYEYLICIFHLRWCIFLWYTFSKPRTKQFIRNTEANIYMKQVQHIRMCNQSKSIQLFSTSILQLFYIIYSLYARKFYIRRNNKKVILLKQGA